MSNQERSMRWWRNIAFPYRKPPGTNILRFDLEEILEWTRRKDYVAAQ